MRGEVEVEDLFRYDAGAIEIVIEPEIRRQRGMRCCGDDAIFEDVGRFEAEDADGFDANVLVRGCVGDDGVGLVGDAAGEDIGGAAAFVADVDEGDFDFFVGAIEIEIEMGKLANAEFAVDADAGVDFFAGVAVGFEADFGFEELDLGGGFGYGGCRSCIGLGGLGLGRGGGRGRVLGAGGDGDGRKKQGGGGQERSVSSRN